MNSKLREILGNYMYETTALDRTDALDRAEKAIRQAVGEEMLELVTDWCQCEDGYIVTGGMAMEDDLVEKLPCEDCSELRQKIKQWAAHQGDI